VSAAWQAVDILYRAIDSAGNTTDFLLSPRRDLLAAKAFLQLALGQARHVQPRVINVDGHPAYPVAIADLKRSGELGRRSMSSCAPHEQHPRTGPSVRKETCRC
jgi:transposase-like protein